MDSALLENAMAVLMYAMLIFESQKKKRDKLETNIKERVLKQILKEGSSSGIDCTKKGTLHVDMLKFVEWVMESE